MANRTIKEAHTVKGTNPQYLIEKIIRTRIYDAKYWKEECFGLSADLLVDRGMDLRFVGGVYGGNIKPSPFLCLILKLLQIQPEKDIIVEYIRQEDSKYLRALGCFYLRLTGTSTEVYNYLEPIYNDYRKLRFMNRAGEFEVLYVDDMVDWLLREERAFDIAMPRLPKRHMMEQTHDLPTKVSALDDDLVDVSDVDEPEKDNKESRRRRSRSHSPRKRRSSRERDREREKPRRRSRSPPIQLRSRKERERREERRANRREREGSSENYGREIKEANEMRAKLGLNPLAK